MARSGAPWSQTLHQLHKAQQQQSHHQAAMGCGWGMMQIQLDTWCLIGTLKHLRYRLPPHRTAPHRTAHCMCCGAGTNDADDNADDDPAYILPHTTSTMTDQTKPSIRLQKCPNMMVGESAHPSASLYFILSLPFPPSLPPRTSVGRYGGTFPPKFLPSPAVQDCSVHLSVNLLMRTSAHHGCWVFLSRRGACSYVLVRHPPKDETAEAFGSVTRMVYTTSPTLSASIQAGGTSARPPAVSATTGDGLSVWPSSAICSKGTCGVVMGCTVQCTVSATFYAYVKRAIAGVLDDGGPFH